MREIRTSGLMSGEGKRSDAVMAQATAPFLDSTEGNGICGEQCLSKAVREAESHSIAMA